MLDRSRPLDSDDLEIFEEVKEKKKVVIMNKKTCLLWFTERDKRSVSKRFDYLHLSSKEWRYEALKETIYALLNSSRNEVVACISDYCKCTHKRVLDKVKESLANSIEMLEKGVSLELIAFEIRSALEALGEVVGRRPQKRCSTAFLSNFASGNENVSRETKVTPHPPYQSWITDFAAYNFWIKPHGLLSMPAF